MRRNLLLLVAYLLCGCSQNKEQIICYYEKETDNYKTAITIKIDRENHETLEAIYQFKNEEIASQNYYLMLPFLEQDETIMIRQEHNMIIVNGNKYDSSINYIEEYAYLGYYCH